MRERTFGQCLQTATTGSWCSHQPPVARPATAGAARSGSRCAPTLAPHPCAGEHWIIGLGMERSCDKQSYGQELYKVIAQVPFTYMVVVYQHARICTSSAAADAPQLHSCLSLGKDLLFLVHSRVSGSSGVRVGTPHDSLAWTRPDRQSPSFTRGAVKGLQCRVLPAFD